MLVRDELKLARLEMTRKGKQAGLGWDAGRGRPDRLVRSGMPAGVRGHRPQRGVTAWLAALIVGMVLPAVSAAAALLGKGRLQKAAPLVPDQAVGSLKADVEEIKQRAHP